MSSNTESPQAESPPSTGSVSSSTTAVAASMATVLTKALLHPLDTLKCRVQIYSTSGGGAPDAARGQRVGVWRRTRQQWSSIRAQYAGKWGPGYLYGGLPVKLVFYVPYQAAYMYGYDTARTALGIGHGTGTDQEQRQQRPDRYVWRTVVAAVAAELSGCLVRVPMETIKMRVQSTVASGSREAFAQLRRNGLLACARLAVPQTLLHDIPYSITQWVVYESLRPWRKRWADVDHHQNQQQQYQGEGSSFLSRYSTEMVRTFCSGGLSGLLAATITVPLDNIRTRVVVATAAAPSLTVREVVQRAYKCDGMRIFVRGGGMRVLWVTANMACYFPLFELFRTMLVHREGNRV